MVVRTYEDELQYLERVNPHCWRIKKGFQPNMNVEVRTSCIRAEKYKPIFTGRILCKLPLGEVDVR